MEELDCNHLYQVQQHIMQVAVVLDIQTMVQVAHLRLREDWAAAEMVVMRRIQPAALLQQQAQLILVVAEAPE
jgi:hypothetical protein